MKKSDTLDYDATAPELTPDTTLLSVDVESNGLHGDEFAVGAVLMKLDGTIVDEYSARCPIEGDVDPWVRKNVFPAMKDFSETHSDAKSMRTDFWAWYKQARDKADYMVASNGYPVEARFLLKCQDDDIEERYWDHFFPILDLASLLIQVGIKPLAIRKRLIADQLEGKDEQHNPHWDAWIAVLVAIKAFKLSGRLA
jgi:hypothetical protein